jgi:hypothetical protein
MRLGMAGVNIIQVNRLTLYDQSLQGEPSELKIVGHFLPARNHRPGVGKQRVTGGNHVHMHNNACRILSGLPVGCPFLNGIPHTSVIYPWAPPCE